MSGSSQKALIYSVSVAEYRGHLRYGAQWPLQVEKALTALSEGFLNSFAITAAPQSPSCPAQSPPDCGVC